MLVYVQLGVMLVHVRLGVMLMHVTQYTHHAQLIRPTHSSPGRAVRSPAARRVGEGLV